LDHSSIRITMDIYGHLLEGVHDREAIQALEVRRAWLIQERETQKKALEETGA
jgi:hypothetical protein